MLTARPDYRPYGVDASNVGATGFLPSQTEGSHDAARRSSSFEELQAVLDLSKKQLEEEARIRDEEEENLRKVLELSLQDY